MEKKKSSFDSKKKKKRLYFDSKNEKEISAVLVVGLYMLVMAVDQQVYLQMI